MTKHLVSLLLLGVLCCLSVQAVSDVIVTAKYNPFAHSGGWCYYTFDEGCWLGQKFLATESGQLVCIDTTIDRAGDTGGVGMSFELRTVESGLPTDTVLSTGFMPYDDPQFDTFEICWKTVQMSPCDIVAGERYAIVANAIPSVEAYDWYTKVGADYSDGAPLSNCGTGWQSEGKNPDLGFRVKVTPVIPEPDVVLLLAAGLASVIARMRRR